MNGAVLPLPNFLNGAYSDSLLLKGEPKIRV